MDSSEAGSQSSKKIPDWLNSEWLLAIALAAPITYLYISALFLNPDVVAKGSFLIGTLATIMVFFVGALSLDLEVGSMGLPNFGKVAFFAIGAYISTLLYSVYEIDFFVSIIIALLISGLVGFLVAIPTVKLRADYFAIMTIAGGEVIRMIFQNEKKWMWYPVLDGPPTQVISNRFKLEMTQSSPFNERLGEFLFYQKRQDFFDDWGLGFVYDSLWDLTKAMTFETVFVWEMTLLIVFTVVAVLTYWFVQQIRKSPYGRTLRAIREDDITVTSVGKDVSRFRWQVTTIAAFICGFAGVMYGLLFSAFEASDFRPLLTFNLYIFIIIGGLGNSRGAFAGTTLATMFMHATQVERVKENFTLHLGPDSDVLGPFFEFAQLDVFINPDNLKLVILGVILILFLLFKPAGLIPEPKTDNEKYMSLLTQEQRSSSDAAVRARQSLTEKERIEAESEGAL
ncbi:MAG: branched-chain amino acid ABC transporter permease [Candidatus Heimdallarchaeota archaeon]